jgi:predicted dehydrogenase
VPGAPIPFALVGTGYRARLIARIAARLPDRFVVTGMLSRHPDAGASIPQVGDLDALLAPSPAFVLPAVPIAATATVVEELVGRGVAVLAETPPASDGPGLHRLWKAVGLSGLVQVAEQYPRHPMTAARIAAVRAGAIGDVGSAEASLTQSYHAVAVLRAVLGVGDAAAEVRAVAHRAPLVAPWSRAGWTRDAEPHMTTTTLATLDFGGTMGRYDFTDGQTRNPLRAFRFLARGSTGEIAGERLVRLNGPQTVVESELVRRDLGGHRDYEDRELVQISLDGEPLWRNAFPGGGLSDEGLAIADLLEATGRWAADDGPAPYPLAEAAQDQLLGLAIAEAAASGAPVRTPAGTWRP